MGTYSYTPAYYSSFHDSITSLCKSILQPLSLRRHRRLPDQNLAERHSDTLKWQQESFHRILHLTGLHKEGIVPESEVSAFRSHLLDTLISSPADPEPTGVIRDKLLFLQELFHAKCISAEEYHSSKRPLLQRLAVQGVEVDCRDVFIGTTVSEEEWAVLDKEPPIGKQQSPGIKSLISKPWRGKGNKGLESHPSILLAESSPLVPVKSEKSKRRAFRALFHKEESERVAKSAKKAWGFEGLKKWKKGGSEEEPLTLSQTPERSDECSLSVPCVLVAASSGRGTKVAKDGRDFEIQNGEGKEAWVSFEENDENLHPNLFARESQVAAAENWKVRDGRSDCFVNNPFWSPKG